MPLTKTLKDKNQTNRFIDCRNTGWWFMPEIPALRR